MTDELSRAQEDTNLIETLAQATTINIPIEGYDNRTRDNNCFYSFLKKYKAKILIKALPYATVAIIGIIMVILNSKDIVTNVVTACVLFSVIVVFISYIAFFQPYLDKKFITAPR